MLRKKKSKEADLDADNAETIATEPQGSSLLERIAAAGQEYGRELEEVAKESLDALRQEQEQLQQQLEPSLQKVRDAEAQIAAAYERYLQALRISDLGALPGSHEALRKAYDQYAAAYAEGVEVAEKADREIGELISRYRAAEEAARAAARQRFAKAFNTYIRAYGEAWTSVDGDAADAGVLMIAAQELYVVAAHAAVSAGAP